METTLETRPPEPPGAITAPAASPQPVPWRRSDWIALLAITFIGGAIRLWRVAIPSTRIFDETYYAKDACWYVHPVRSICGISGEQTPVHPPLGKWLISIGIQLFGYNSFGWRIAPVVAGTLTIALLYVLARRVLGSTLGATLSAGLFGVDFLHFVQSRTSMLDVFVPLFGLAAVLCAVYDRDRMRASQASRGDGEPAAAPPARRSRLSERRWRVSAGVLAGAATACKWSGAFILLTVIVLTVAWEVSAWREQGAAHPFLKMLDREGASLVFCLGIVPLVVYMLSYIGRLDGTLLAWPWSQGSWLKAWWDRQLYMEAFHHNLTAQHSYESPAWTWLLLKRPVSYYFTTTAGGKYDEVLALGSPFVWWAGILALLYVAFAWLKRFFASLVTPEVTLRPRNRGPEGLILAGFFFSYLPWLLPQLGRPAIFLFYLLPALPFLYLALGYVAVRLGRSWEANLARALFAAGAVGLFAFYYPLLAAVAIPQPDWNSRVAIFNHCAKPRGPLTTTVISTKIKGTPTTKQTTTHDNSDLPPKGWCWI